MPNPRPTQRAGDRLNDLLTWWGLVLAIGLLLFFRYYLAELASGGRAEILPPLIREITGAVGGGLLFFAVRRLFRARPLEPHNWPRRLPLYLAALLLYSIAHTSFNWTLRSVLFWLCDLGPYDYGVMPLRYAMELPSDVVTFSLMIAALYGVSRLREAQARELRTVQLESNLARAELSNLRLQLQPHFLFNTLNTISSTMYDDPATADEMLDRLAELLRASLRTARADEVPLAEELETLDCYLDIMRARFGERLRVDFHQAKDLDDALVPSMLLQPLFENAIRHGGVEKTGQGHIRLTIRELSGPGQDSRLELRIEDDGPGLEKDESPTPGIGLQATADRLKLLYGETGHFAAGTIPQGGFRVDMILPLRRRSTP